MRKLLLSLICMFVVGVLSLRADDLNWLTVNGNAEQKQDPNFAVTYSFKIMKCEVTVEQYCEFLNAIAGKLDTYSLYDKNMPITRTGSAFSYKYTVKPQCETLPIAYINFYRAMRFANWIHNGKPTGKQNSKTTENGAYDLKSDLSKHNANAKVWIPTEKEWYKTAYYDYKLSDESGKASYWDFADRTTYAKARYPYPLPPPGGPHSANYAKKFKGPTPVGAYEQAMSGYGAYDMNGNLFEWTETATKDGYRNIRGGSWDTPNGYVYRKKRTGARIKEIKSGYGFRLAGKL